MQEAICLLEISEQLIKSNVEREQALQIIHSLKKLSFQANQRTEKYQKALHLVTSTSIPLDENALSRLTVINPNKQYTVSEIAETIGVSQKHAYKLLNQTSLKSFKLAGKKCFLGSDLIKFAKNH